MLFKVSTIVALLATTALSAPTPVPEEGDILYRKGYMPNQAREEGDVLYRKGYMPKEAREEGDVLYRKGYMPGDVLSKE